MSSIRTIWTSFAPRVLGTQLFRVRPQFWMDETVEHVSKGFLGLTMNCAKCHDHKFDPIKQADYYRMRAFFEPYYVRMDIVPTEPDLTRDGIPRVFDGSSIADVPVRSRPGDESRQVKAARTGSSGHLCFQRSGD